MNCGFLIVITVLAAQVGVGQVNKTWTIPRTPDGHAPPELPPRNE